MYMSLTSLVLIIQCFLICSAEHIIHTPRYSDFGTWGDWEYCPSGQFVNGFQLQVEAPRGEFGDDTALNSIRFFCGPVGGSFNHSNFITSRQGYWGSWGQVYTCVDNSTAIGIQLRVEKSQGILDDTGANNLRMVCSDRLVHEGDGTIWGKWLTKSLCPRRTALCGLRTLVESWDRSDVLDNDDTALNNADIACCDVPSPAKSCTPKERWEFVAHCDNTVGTETKECEFESKDDTPNYWTDVTRISKTYKDLGMRIEDDYVDLIRTFHEKLGKSKRTGFDWKAFGGSLMSKKAHLKLKAPPGEKQYLYRLLAKCGIYHINSEYFKIFDEELDPSLTSFDY